MTKTGSTMSSCLFLSGHFSLLDLELVNVEERGKCKIVKIKPLTLPNDFVKIVLGNFCIKNRQNSSMTSLALMSNNNY